ncbi:MAG: ADOP family duplicated permease [Thermoanaerobaculia bacterium]|nr:ADOP family duplicated permease [Thermoanaerobaculia bacterium]
MSLILDLRYAARLLRRQPVFTSLAVLSLALAVGVNASVFSILEALVLRPVAGVEADGLVRLQAVGSDGTGFHSFSYPDFLDYRELGTDTVSGVAAEYLTAVILGEGEAGRTVLATVVSENYFDVLGVQPAAGRFFLPAEGRGFGAHPVAVVDHRLWQRELGGDASILGQEVRVNAHLYTVVGVAPAEFGGTVGGLRSAVYLPLAMYDQVNPGSTLLTHRDTAGLNFIARQRPGAGLEAIAAEMTAIAGDLTALEGRSPLAAPASVAALPLSRLPPGVGTVVRTFLLMLMAVVLTVLLVASVNVANMILARSAGRRREIAVRISSGASRARVVRQLLTETVLLFVVGGVAGAGLAAIVVRILPSIELPLPVQLELDPALNLPVAGFTLGLSLLAGLTVGALPALRSSRDGGWLSERSATATRREGFLRGALVVAQVALSLALVVVAGLFLRSLGRASAIDPGFDPAGVDIAVLELSTQGYDRDRALPAFHRWLDAVEARPEVGAAALADSVPLSISNQTTAVTLEGEEPYRLVDTMMVTGGFFRTLGIALEDGRTFDPALDRDGTPGAVVVNRTFAERFLAGESPLGRRFRVYGYDEPVTVVGVVADTKVRTLGEEPRPFLYTAFDQAYTTDAMTLYARAASPGGSTAAAVGEETARLDPGLVLTTLSPLERTIGVSLLPQQVASLVSAATGVLGLALASVGLYAVVALSVGRRRREFGLRLAVGATAGDLVRRVLRGGGALGALGIGIGLLLAAGAARLLATYLYGLGPFDLPTVAASVGLFAAVIVAASLGPALRAARTDPVRALREE